MFGSQLVQVLGSTWAHFSGVRVEAFTLKTLKKKKKDLIMNVLVQFLLFSIH